jgi:hypothetical protein
MNTHRRPAVARPTGTRRAFALPIVIIAVTLATTLGGALVTASFHATRGSRMAWQGERALHAADLALANASANWTSPLIANLAIGERNVTSSSAADGITVTLTAVRTSSTTLLLNAIAVVAGGPTTIAKRELARVLHLDASAIPIKAAVATLGTLSSAQSPRIFAVGDSTRHEASCGLEHDTASTAALLAVPPLTTDSTTLDGAPRIRSISVDSATTLRTAIWNRIGTLGTSAELSSVPISVTPTASGTDCTSNSGEPRRNAAAVTPCIAQWPTRRLANTSGRVTLASSRHQGALVVHGDLELTGHLELRGLLLVEGNIDARNGSLEVTGAIIATHHNGGTSHLGNESTVRFSRCAALRAVTALARSAPPPVLAWVQRY